MFEDSGAELTFVIGFRCPLPPTGLESCFLLFTQKLKHCRSRWGHQGRAATASYHVATLPNPAWCTAKKRQQKKHRRTLTKKKAILLEMKFKLQINITIMRKMPNNSIYSCNIQYK